MSQYFLIRPAEFTGGAFYQIPEDLKGMEQLKDLDELFQKLGDSDGAGDEIYLSRLTAAYEGTLKEKYPKATIIVADTFKDPAQ
ncbi:MAG: hypothetical protein LBV19_01225 [Streptococcaceae bacterium]|jgi:hypothetical protein|nr:hypothetical protein [Streptococcaceae bacterium]